jgi:hypothetical protein
LNAFDLFTMSSFQEKVKLQYKSYVLNDGSDFLIARAAFRALCG